MSRAEKASEPSMEEILASIRKIISEDPAGLSGGQGGAQGSGQANANIKAVAVKPEIVAALEARAPGLLSSLGQVSPAAPSIDPSSRGSQAVSVQPAPVAGRNVSGAAVQTAKPSAANLDDILGLADGAGPPSAPAPASPALQKTSPSAPSALGAAAAAVLPAALSRPIPTATERAPVQPFFPPQSRDLPPFGSAFPTGSGPGPAASATDFRAVVPGRADGGRPDLSRAESARVAEIEAGAPRFSDIRPDNPLADRGGTGSGPAVRALPITASPAPSPAPPGTGLMGPGLNGPGFNGSYAQPIAPVAAAKPNEPVAEKAAMPVAAEVVKPAVQTAPKVVAETKIEAPKPEAPKS